jgi:hypothetical protein
MKAGEHATVEVLECKPELPEKHKVGGYRYPHNRNIRIE